MYTTDLDSIVTSDYSWLQEFLDAHSIPNNPFDTQPTMAGHSIHTPDSFYDGYLNQDVIDLDTLPAPHSLSDFSISHLPSTTNFEQITLNLLPENSLAVFSQPSSRPVAKVDPLHKDPQEQVTIETSQFKAHESSGSDEPRPLTLAVPHEQSGKIKVAKARTQSEKEKDRRKAYEQSERGKTVRKAYEQSERGKTVRKAYEQSEKGKAYRKAYLDSEKRKAARKAHALSKKGKDYQRTYRQSEKGKAVRKAYQQSERGKAVKKKYQQSDKGMAVKKTYQQSEKGKATKRAYEKSEQRKAYIKVYYKVLRNTGDKEQARIAAKQAAAFVRKSNKAKNNELESTSMS
ncbi:hypothetical protein [Salinisphaera sp. G21_0]|uniref:hypothetical protein n=1 Tax=Salinisphaera sp. G21_0 TaxID=2821094 RepID=UPI001ADAEF9F|nr:hypothetical protein [Salinisphaera sp. G21_0]MBO9482653.1 hypothetical protein [Salinisphaera sp. G21_0]